MADIGFPRLQQAVFSATQWHLGQYREGPGALPYITHPIEVLTNVRFVGGVTDEDMLCAAALHDVLEQTNADPMGIELEFGKRVRGLVVELTRREPDESEVQGLSKDEIWQLRADMLLAEIEKMSPDAQVVKLGDRLANVLDAKRVKKAEKFARYMRQTRRILEVVPRDRNPALWEAIRAAAGPD